MNFSLDNTVERVKFRPVIEPGVNHESSRQRYLYILFGADIAARRSYAEKNSNVVKRFIRAAFEGIRQIYDNKESAMKTLAKYTKLTDEKLLDESYRFSVEALSKDASMPAEAFTALVDQMVSQKSVDAGAAKKIPVSAYCDNRYVDELEKEGFFKKLWQ